MFRDLTRDEAIAAALEIAERKAINAGADPGSLKTIEVMLEEFFGVRVCPAGGLMLKSLMAQKYGTLVK